ncbi:XdhC family protein [Bacillus amyloliquefaciens]|uniref:XdhC family protein n=1 Tax=Bacillus amyloliquefaciens TaxID=1390 RepID=UPI0022B07D81|nr:XdhC family protein [Bacillus amyloliquefaciens]MCZ4247379.1 XdhC family protein [Bacillus amyloliquefaciens]
MDDIHRILDVIANSAKPKVLATIIKTEGSAYKKEGASMLILGDKTRVGMLSAGCLEDDLAERSEQVWAAGEPLIVHFDMSAEDDLSWGQGVGCNGVLTVLLEPVKGELERHLMTVKKCLDGKKSVTRVKRFTETLEPKEDMYIAEDGSVFGTGDFMEQVQKLKNPLYDTEKGIKKDEHTSDLFFIHQMIPKPCLYVFGAGEDAKPLVSLAAGTGFHVTVIDWRPALCNNGHFPEAGHLIAGVLEEVMEGLSITHRDFIIIMTHSFQKDRTILHKFKDEDVFYKGVLGPRRRTKRLLGGAEIPEDIHSPIGLSIGAQGPEEIAVSIVGEMIKKMRKQGSVL